MKGKRVSMVCFLISFTIFAYVLTISALYEVNVQNQIDTMKTQVTRMETVQIENDLDECHAYNAKLLEREYAFTVDETMKQEYESLLQVGEEGQMCVLSIPSINLNSVVYHGMDESVLQKGVGHAEWSSLPVGGQSTHAVLSAHTGLAHAPLFTKLDQVKTGELFTIEVYDRILTYEVISVYIGEPYDMNHLRIQMGEDLCTLVTCYPRNQLDRRLSVTGRRILPVQNTSIH